MHRSPQKKLNFLLPDDSPQSAGNGKPNLEYAGNDKPNLEYAGNDQEQDEELDDEQEVINWAINI